MSLEYSAVIPNDRSECAADALLTILLDLDREIRDLYDWPLFFNPVRGSMDRVWDELVAVRIAMREGTEAALYEALDE